MNQLYDLRTVDFHGDELSVLRMNDDEKVYVSVRNICRALELDENRAKAQRLKINSDPVLMRGKRMISIPTPGGAQEALCLDIEFLPIWLAKINGYILPENVKDKVVEYQLNAKEVLSRVFLHNESVVPANQVFNMDLQQLNPETQALVMLVNNIAQTQIEQKKQAMRISSVERHLQDIKDVYTLSSRDESWRDKTNNIINTVCRNLGDYHAPKTALYDEFNRRAHCNVNLRVANMKNRATEAGWAKSRVDAINKLDAIAADERLKEIYIQVVREFAIHHGYSEEDVENI